MSDDDARGATVSDEAHAFYRALDGADRVSVYRENALGEWDVETFSPEAIRNAMRGTSAYSPAALFRCDQCGRTSRRDQCGVFRGQLTCLCGWRWTLTFTGKTADAKEAKSMASRDIAWGDAGSHGAMVPGEALRAAFLRWEPARGYMRLAALLEQEACQFGVVRAEWYRIADRMIQKARKSGVIRLGAGRKWEWVE